MSRSLRSYPQEEKLAVILRRLLKNSDPAQKTMGLGTCAALDAVKHHNIDGLSVDQKKAILEKGK